MVVKNRKDGRSLFVGYGLGFVTVSDVPAGTYTVRAPFLGAEYESTVEVVGGEGARLPRSTSFPQSSITTT